MNSRREVLLNGDTSFSFFKNLRYEKDCKNLVDYSGIISNVLQLRAAANYGTVSCGNVCALHICGYHSAVDGGGSNVARAAVYFSVCHK